MSGDVSPPSDKIPGEVKEKSRKELEAILGIRKLVNGRGTPRIWLVALIVGFTVVLILFATFVNWLWWIPACIFIFGLAIGLFVFLQMRRQQRKGV